jgi:hypothetical protein
MKECQRSLLATGIHRFYHKEVLEKSIGCNIQRESILCLETCPHNTKLKDKCMPTNIS